MSTYVIPHFGLARQYANLKEELLEATDQSMRNGVLMDGAFTRRFESWLKTKVGCSYALVVHSGTQALEMIAEYIADEDVGYSLNGELIPTVNLPNLTYPATLNAFMNTGWNVNLLDVDKNGLIRGYYDRLDSEYTCYVGMYGANIRATNSHNSIVDGAQHWLVAGGTNIGRAMAISFDPTKNLPSSGNGGAIVTNDPRLYDALSSYRSNGKPIHHSPGTNSRMSELECSHMMVRTKYLDSWQTRRRDIRMYYLDAFNNMPFRCLSRDIAFHADQKFVIYDDQRRDELFEYLNTNGIEAKIHYPRALSELQVARTIVNKPDMLSTSVMMCRNVLSLPIYPELSDSEIEIIVAKVKAFYTK